MVRFIAAICAIVWLVPLQASIADNLNIYTHRQPTLLEPILKAYTKKTGVTFSTVYAPKGLVQRLQLREIRRIWLSQLWCMNCPRRDCSHLYPRPKLKNKSLPTCETKSDEWTALSLRARIAAVSIQRVEKSEVLGLADLVKPAMKGRVCTRVGSHVYNRALLASIIANDGEAAARAWARGLIENLARKPQGNDRAQAKAIYSGECDVALMNTYYYGKMKFNEKNPEQKNWANSHF